MHIQMDEITSQNTEIAPEQDIQAAIVHVSIPKRTRTDKISSILRDFSQNIANHEIIQGIWLDPIYFIDEQIEKQIYDLLNNKQFEIVIRPHSNKLENESNRCNADTYVHTTTIEHSSQYEKIFSKLAASNYTGVAFDVESFTRGHIALANKFSLHTAITGIKYNRQFEMASQANVQVQLIH